MSAYHRPSTLDDAVALLRTGSPTILAGATDVYPARTTRIAWGQRGDPDILDITAIAGLRGIADRGDHWWIGALTTWRDIIDADMPACFDALKQAAREIGGIQIQNRGTIAGNCCTASPAGDSIPCLLALDATFEIAGPSPRTLAAADFFNGYRRTALAPSELVTGLRIPKQTGMSAFRKFGARKYLVISIAMVAAVVETERDGIVRSARLAVGACSAVAQRLPALEAALCGAPLGSVSPLPGHFDHLSPLDDIRASADYRRQAALELTRDVLAALAHRQNAEAAHD